MGLATNCIRRGAMYCFRARVPTELVKAFGRVEVWKSLRTRDPREARRLLPAAQAEFHAECDAKRRALATALVSATTAAPKHNLTDDDLRRYAAELYAWELERDANDRLPHGQGGSTRRLLHEVGAVTLNAGLVQQALAMGDEEGRVQVADFADMVCERDGIPKHGGAYQRLCQALLRARVEIDARARERDAGDFGGRPSDELLITPTKAQNATPDAPDTAGETLAALCADYIAQRRDVSAEWQRAIIAALTEFKDFFGSERPLAAVQRKDVARYKAALLKVSAHAVRRGEKLAFKQLVERGRDPGEKGLANGSINRRLSALSKFGAWAVGEGHVDQNVFAGLALEKMQETKRRSFTVDMLRKVFASPLFVGCASEARGSEHVPGTALIHDWRFWAVPLALFTGARLGEILQLRCEDVCEVQGLRCIRINDRAEEGGQASRKRVKNDASQRLVPLHDAILSLGFLEHVASLRAKGEPRVFPDLKPDNLGREATEPSKFLNRYLERIGVKQGPAIVFHSLRHTLIDGLRDAGHADPTIAAIVGHTKSDGLLMTGTYGEKVPVPGLTLADKARIIGAVTFADLNLSHLSPDVRRAKAKAEGALTGPVRKRPKKAPVGPRRGAAAVTGADGRR